MESVEHWGVESQASPPSLVDGLQACGLADEIHVPLLRKPRTPASETSHG